MKSIKEVQDMFIDARNNNNVAYYEKFAKVDARPAKAGEVVVTIVNGKEETRSKAEAGDYVVRARSEDKQMYVVKSDKFSKRYKSTGGEQDEYGWREYQAVGDCYGFVYSGEEFSFEAPWGEKMIVEDGDYIVSIDLVDLSDIYRIEKDAMKETYKKTKDIVVEVV
jgi:hypothetical protein